MMDLSIVIPSFQGESRLPGLMQALAAQVTTYQWEAIVVLDGSDDRSEAVLETWKHRLPVKVIARRDNRGRSYTLNQGFEAARGQVLVRCDDDLLPGINYVQRFGDLLHHSHKIGVIGLYRNTYPDNAYARVYGRPVDERFRSEAYAVQPEKRWTYWAGNCGVRSEVWEEVGPYDESFREYGWEDIDWGFRLAQSGVTVHLDRQLETLHRVAATTVEIRLSRAFQSGQASAKFYAKHPSAVPADPPMGGWGFAVRNASAILGRSGSRFWGRTLPIIPPLYSRRIVDLAVQATFYRGQRLAREAMRSTLH